MAINIKQYKCIYCDELKDSEKACTCPVCGYRMFPTPYDKRNVISSEIKNFITHLENNKLVDEDFILQGKSKDDNRFPGFYIIQSNACAANKTEIFFERLFKAVDEIQKHIHTPFKGTYKVDYQKIYEIVQKNEIILKKVVEVIGEEVTFEVYDAKEETDKLLFPETMVDYQEIPNKELLGKADDIIIHVRKLAEKLRFIIKKNNIYGSVHTRKPEDVFAPKDDVKLDYDIEFDKCLKYLENLIAKKYEIDIFSDGAQEQEEMLGGIWSAIALIMRAPVLVHDYKYNANGTPVGKEEYYEQISSIIYKRYDKINAMLLNDTFFERFTEEELFDIYDRMIEIDQFRFFGVDVAKLLKVGKYEKELNSLIGLSLVKNSILKIKAYAIANKDNADLNLHMCFYGNPGTGKTEVARIIAGILYENKVLPKNKFVEVDRSGLVGEYLGETPIKTMNKINQAMGGVLFIDEAYSLAAGDTRGYDYGHEAIATLIKAMEDKRGKFCVILAGYKTPMEQMIASNPGFKSRIQFELDFPNYSREELDQIISLMLNKKKYTISDVARNRMLDVTDVKRKDPNFANAREIRNILDQSIMCQNIRCIGTDDKNIELVDINRYIQDSKIMLPTEDNNSRKRIMTGEEELEALIGLSSVKRMVKKIKAYAKRNSQDTNFNIHMAFSGNPGTGKTEVARIISRVLHDAGVLNEAKLVETDAHGLIGRYVGETGPKTKAKVEEAMGGVLFIDEAYALTEGESAGGTSTSYGDEAIAVLLKEMEDKRGRFCVILAGYQDKMANMISSNPGFKSRIQFELTFPDYSREELEEIAVKFLKQKGYTIGEDAMSRVLDLAEWYRLKPDFANARTIRNILDQVIMNQNLRTDESGNSNDCNILKEDVDNYIEDEGLMKESGHHLGFRI